MLSIFRGFRSFSAKRNPSPEVLPLASSLVLTGARPSGPQGFQVTRPGTIGTDVPSRWALATSPLSPAAPGMHSSSQPASLRSDSPANYQHANLGGGSLVSLSSPEEFSRLRVTNPDNVGRSISGSTLSLVSDSSHAAPPATPIRGNTPQPLGTNRERGPDTFAEMGFVQVKKRFSWMNPSTWISGKTYYMLKDNIDPRKYMAAPKSEATVEPRVASPAVEPSVPNSIRIPYHRPTSAWPPAARPEGTARRG